MSDLEQVVGLMHANPETLSGVPSDVQIIEGEPDLRRWPIDLTAGERAGFLQLWQGTFLREQIEDMPESNVAAIYTQATKELAELAATERRISDLRLIAHMSRHALFVKGYDFANDNNGNQGE